MNFKKIYYENFKKNIIGDCDGVVDNVHFSFLNPLPNFLNGLLNIKNHPNRYEYLSFLKSLRKLSKNITVTDYRFTAKKIYSDLTIGFGHGVDASLREDNFFIYYATGSSSKFQHLAVLREFLHVKDIYGISSLNFFRIPEKFDAYKECTAKKIYVIGNEFTKNTFMPTDVHIRCLPGIALNSDIDFNLPEKNTLNGREVLWMGSKGVLHKGLHLAAEVAKRNNVKLIVVGVSDDELLFAKKILDTSGCFYELNGYLKIGSDEWINIVNRVDFVLGCSISEGMSTALLTCARYGIYPIATDTCGLDIGHKINFEPRSNLTERISHELEIFMKLSIKEFNRLKKDMVKNVLKKNTIKNFDEKLYEYLVEDLNSFTESC